MSVCVRACACVCEQCACIIQPAVGVRVDDNVISVLALQNLCDLMQQRLQSGMQLLWASSRAAH